MLDKILFWVVLAWMVALLVMAFMAVREVWKEDAREPDDAGAGGVGGAKPADTGPGGSGRPEPPAAGTSGGPK